MWLLINDLQLKQLLKFSQFPPCSQAPLLDLRAVCEECSMGLLYSDFRDQQTTVRGISSLHHPTCLVVSSGETTGNKFEVN